MDTALLEFSFIPTCEHEQRCLQALRKFELANSLLAFLFVAPSAQGLLRLRFTYIELFGKFLRTSVFKSTSVHLLYNVQEFFERPNILCLQCTVHSQKQCPEYILYTVARAILR